MCTLVFTCVHGDWSYSLWSSSPSGLLSATAGSDGRLLLPSATATASDADAERLIGGRCMPSIGDMADVTAAPAVCRFIIEKRCTDNRLEKDGSSSVCTNERSLACVRRIRRTTGCKHTNTRDETSLTHRHTMVLTATAKTYFQLLQRSISALRHDLIKLVVLHQSVRLHLRPDVHDRLVFL